MQNNMFKGFHEAGPSIEQGLTQWTAEYEKIGGSSQASQQITDLSSNLTTALDKLPQLTEQKKKVDMHVKIASKVLKEIKERQIDKMQDIEEEAITTRKLVGENKQDLLGIFATPTPESAAASTPERNPQFLDKIRILVILILCLKDTDDLQKYLQIVEDAHKHIPSQVAVLEKVKIMFRKKVDMKGKQSNTAQSDANASSAQSSTLDFAYSLGKGIASGLSSLLSDSNNFSSILAREIDQMQSHVRLKYTQQGTWFLDTLTGEKTQMVSYKDMKQVFAFAIGGGSFYEYETIKVIVENIEEAQSTPAQPGKASQGTASNKPTVIYGCDYLFQPTEFLDEIMKLN